MCNLEPARNGSVSFVQEPDGKPKLEATDPYGRSGIAAVIPAYFIAAIQSELAKNVRVLHFNVTRHPTSAWIVQQLREVSYQSAPKYLIFDHAAKYGLEVPAAIRFMKITRIQTSFQSPWQNGVAERWVGSCRRELITMMTELILGCARERLAAESVLRRPAW